MDPADTAIILMNLGGPLRSRDVEPFLTSLFMDRDAMRLGPAFLQPLFARIIARSRLKDAGARYQEIGGSPILRETAAQAAALREALRGAGRREPVKVAFRHAPPRIGGLLRALAMQGVGRVLPVSLYPHACRATTGSSLAELARAAQSEGMAVLAGVRHYPTAPDYLACLEDNLRRTLALAPGATVVFSAHSLPLSLVRSGDPYVREIESTVEALKARLGDVPGGFRLAYQSKVGFVRWLEPSLDDVLAGLAGRDVVIVPVSFVGEHVETLYELDIQYREVARRAGIRGYHRTAAPGTHPLFIKCLARLTMEALERS